MDKQKTYWDTFTTSYQMGHQKHRDYLLDLLRDKGVISLLDVGCGTGPIYQIIKEDRERWKNFIHYKGTDYSWAMIKIAKESFPEANWEVEDARHLNEEDNSFDCVLLMHCLDHLDDYKAAIKEAARVTRDYVCIVLWRPFLNSDENHINNRNMYGKVEGEEPWEDTHLQEYSRQKLEEAFKEAGLEIVETAEGDKINSDGSHYNFLFLLKKK